LSVGQSDGEDEGEGESVLGSALGSVPVLCVVCADACCLGDEDDDGEVADEDNDEDEDDDDEDEGVFVGVSPPCALYTPAFFSPSFFFAMVSCCQQVIRCSQSRACKRA
jgi:hypothetical protein